MARRGSATVVRYDGSAWTRFDCAPTKDGTLRQVSEPHYEFSADVCVNLGEGVYVISAAEPTLRSESDFHQLRRRVVLRSLFTNTGDLMELARNIATVVALVVAVMLWFQFGSLSGTIGKMSGQLQAVQHQLTLPIQVEVPGSSGSSTPVPHR